MEELLFFSRFNNMVGFCVKELILRDTSTGTLILCFCFFRADGACRHVAAALFDLEATIRRNELETCTSVPCVWVKRQRITENAVPMADLSIKKSEYGKEAKDCKKPFHFLNPLCSYSSTQSFKDKFYDALLETNPSIVALQFIPKPPIQAVSEKELLEQISSEDIDHEEIVEYAEVYSLKEFANIFIAKNSETSFKLVTVGENTQFCSEKSAQITYLSWRKEAC